MDNKKNKFQWIKKKLVAFFSGLFSIKQFIENIISYYIPPLGYIFKWRNEFFDQQNAEQNLFINKMPKWYGFFEGHWLGRGFRVCMGLFLFFYWSSQTPNLIKSFLNVDLDNLSYFYKDIGLFLAVFCFIFFFFFSSLKLILSFIYFKELTFNSPFNLRKCIMWGMRRICSISFITGVFGFGFSIVDYGFKNRGYVEPLDGFFQNAAYKITEDITPVMASERSKNLKLLKDESFYGAKLIREYGQMNTLRVQAEHAQIYQAQQEIQLIKQDSENLIKNGQYKRD